MSPENILDLFTYMLIESGEQQYLHDPASARSKIAQLWEEVVRHHCHNSDIVSQIDTMIAKGKATALKDFEEQMYDRY